MCTWRATVISIVLVMVGLSGSPGNTAEAQELTAEELAGIQHLDRLEARGEAGTGHLRRS